MSVLSDVDPHHELGNLLERDRIAGCKRRWRVGMMLACQRNPKQLSRPVLPARSVLSAGSECCLIPIWQHYMA